MIKFVQNILDPTNHNKCLNMYKNIFDNILIALFVLNKLINVYIYIYIYIICVIFLTTLFVLNKWINACVIFFVVASTNYFDCSLVIFKLMNILFEFCRRILPIPPCYQLYFEDISKKEANHALMPWENI